MFTEIIYGNHSELAGVIENFATVACEVIVLLCCNRLYEHSFFPKIFQSKIDKSKNMLLLAKAVTYGMSILSLFVIASLTTKIQPYISQLFLKSDDMGFFCNIFITPIAVYVCAIIFRILPSVFEDVAAMCTASMLIFYKMACYWFGCCYGVKYDGIFYNESLREYQVPVQLIELVCAIVMFIILVLLFKKKKMSGNLYPLFMIMYCGSRFISEFWRGDYSAIVCKMNGNHIQCLIGFVLGVIYILIGLIFGKKINASVQKDNETYVETTKKKVPEWRKNRPILWEILKYQVAGIIPTTAEVIVHMWFLDIVFYKLSDKYINNLLLVSIGIKSVGYFWSFILSTAVGYSIGFVLSKKFVFRSDADTKRSLVKYFFLVVFTVFVSGWIGSAIQSYAEAIHFTGLIEDVIIKVIVMIIPFIWVYPCNKYIVHRDHNKK